MGKALAFDRRVLRMGKALPHSAGEPRPSDQERAPGAVSDSGGSLAKAPLRRQRIGHFGVRSPAMEQIPQKNREDLRTAAERACGHAKVEIERIGAHDAWIPGPAV